MLDEIEKPQLRRLLKKVVKIHEVDAFNQWTVHALTKTICPYACLVPEASFASSNTYLKFKAFELLLNFSLCKLLQTIYSVLRRIQ